MMSHMQIRPRLVYLDVDTAEMALENRIEHVHSPGFAATRVKPEKFVTR